MTVPFGVNSTKYEGMYRGIVVDNNDPDKAGKIKIAIRPMFQGIPTSDLPWAVPSYPIFEGSGNGIGYFAVPKVGTYVYTFFEEGDINQPVYFGEAPTKIHGIPSSATTNYPNRKVMKTTSGVEIIIDDTAKSIDFKTPAGMEIKVDDTTNTMSILHPTGAFVKIDAAGQVLINGLNITITTSGVTNWTGSGAINITGSSVNINP